VLKKSVSLINKPPAQEYQNRFFPIQKTSIPINQDYYSKKLEQFSHFNKSIISYKSGISGTSSNCNHLANIKVPQPMRNGVSIRPPMPIAMPMPMQNVR
jgi:hypothetical protein